MKIKNMSLNIFTLILIFLLNITTMKAEAETRGGHYLAGLKSWKTSGSFTRLELDDENISGYVKGKYANIYKELDGKGRNGNRSKLYRDKPVYPHDILECIAGRKVGDGEGYIRKGSTRKRI